MPTPFPGMDPYLERAADWGDFHSAFVPFLRGAIERQIPEPYRTRIDENVYIHERSAEERRLIGRPDLHLSSPRLPTPTSGTVTMPSPTIGGVPEGIEIVELPFLEIRDERDDTVITTIEVLSPCNKDGSGDAEVYRTKVLNLLRSKANFVEIDLLRGGKRTNWTGLPGSDYAVAVSRRTDRPRVSLWPIAMRERLPTIPIPLTDDLPPLMIDLQAVMNEVYDSARYGRYIYDKPPEPSLSDADAEWANGILHSR